MRLSESLFSSSSHISIYVCWQQCHTGSKHLVLDIIGDRVGQEVLELEEDLHRVGSRTVFNYTCTMVGAAACITQGFTAFGGRVLSP